MHSVLIKLLPCFILTLISFILIRVLYKASKRKIKLKGYSYQPATTNPQETTAMGATTINTNGGSVPMPSPSVPHTIPINTQTKK